MGWLWPRLVSSKSNLNVELITISQESHPHPILYIRFQNIFKINFEWAKIRVSQDIFLILKILKIWSNWWSILIVSLMIKLTIHRFQSWVCRFASWVSEEQFHDSRSYYQKPWLNKPNCWTNWNVLMICTVNILLYFPYSMDFHYSQDLWWNAIERVEYSKW